MEFILYKSELQEKIDACILNYNKNLSKILLGRANPKLLDSINVKYYNDWTPINQIASISVPEARQLLIKPFDSSLITLIVSAINSSSLGLNAINEGHQVRIPFAELNQEKRREMVKVLFCYAEQAKVSIRQARQEINKMIKNDKELSDDNKKDYLNKIQTVINKYIDKVNKITKDKERDLLTI